jgi:peroxiredoxin
MEEIEELGFTAPAVTEDDIFEYSFDGEGLSVLVFFPGAFTTVCTKEVCEFRDSMKEMNDLGAEVIGISVDTPFSLDAFREQYDLNFKLVSDNRKEIIDQYHVRTDFTEMGFTGLAQRAIFVVKDREIVYREVLDDPDNMPDLERLRAELEKIKA